MKNKFLHLQSYRRSGTVSQQITELLKDIQAVSRYRFKQLFEAVPAAYRSQLIVLLC